MNFFAKSTLAATAIAASFAAVAPAQAQSRGDEEAIRGIIGLGGAIIEQRMQRREEKREDRRIDRCANNLMNDGVHPRRAYRICENGGGYGRGYRY